jgi:hypothetical protein
MKTLFIMLLCVASILCNAQQRVGTVTIDSKTYTHYATPEITGGFNHSFYSGYTGSTTGYVEPSISVSAPSSFYMDNETVHFRDSLVVDGRVHRMYNPEEKLSMSYEEIISNRTKRDAAIVYLKKNMMISQNYYETWQLRQ